MGLTPEFLDSHVTYWENKLKGAIYPYRENWPKYLFHHAPLENVVGILASGRLLSRIDSQQHRLLDIAAPGVIDSNTRVHRFGRMYFRPRHLLNSM